MYERETPDNISENVGVGFRVVEQNLDKLLFYKVKILLNSHSPFEVEVILIRTRVLVKEVLTTLCEVFEKNILDEIKYRIVTSSFENTGGEKTEVYYSTQPWCIC